MVLAFAVLGQGAIAATSDAKDADDADIVAFDADKVEALFATAWEDSSNEFVTLDTDLVEELFASAWDDESLSSIEGLNQLPATAAGDKKPAED